MKRQLQRRVKPTSEEGRAAVEFGMPTLRDTWGGSSVISSRVPSGMKLIMHSDEDCILKYLGPKDISDIMGKDEGTVIYHSFVDGKRVVTMPCSFAFNKVDFKADYYYYIWNQAEIDMGHEGHNPMKDFMIRELGQSGDEIQCPKRVADSGTLVLSDEKIEEINYSRLNYPLR